MSRIRRFSGQEVRKIPEAHRFVCVRQRGSHMVMQRAEGGATITAIVPDHDELRTGTLLSVIRQSRLPRELFEV